MWVTDAGRLPGVYPELDTIENQFAWGRRELQFVWGANLLDGATRDAGSSPTFELRPGLLLGLITATKKYKEYNPASTDGSQVARAILPFMTRITDLLGTNADRAMALIVGGPVKAAQIYGLDPLARAQMFGHFWFDDDFVGNRLDFVITTAITADKTVSTADNGTHFVVTGGTGVTFTVHAPARGYSYRFTNMVDQNMTITTAAGTALVTFNNAAATSVAFSTGGNKIGATVDLVASPDGTKWLVMPRGANTMTVA